MSQDFHQNILTMKVEPAMLMAVTNHLKWRMLGYGCDKLFKSVAALLQHTAPDLRGSCLSPLCAQDINLVYRDYPQTEGVV